MGSYSINSGALHSEGYQRGLRVESRGGESPSGVEGQRPDCLLMNICIKFAKCCQISYICSNSEGWDTLAIPHLIIWGCNPRELHPCFNWLAK